MNLYDVINVIETPAIQTTVDENLLLSVYQANCLFDRLGVNVPGEVYDSANALISQERQKAFVANDCCLAESDFPHKQFDSRTGEILENMDHLSKLSASPRSSLSDLRMIADKLGMVIMPFQALTNKSLENEEEFERCMVERFVEASNLALMDNYVIAPIALYDIYNHVRMKPDDAQQLYSKNFEQVFMSIQLQIPLFRMIMGTIENLSHRISELEDTTNQIKNQIISLQTQLKQIQSANEAKRIKEAQKRDRAAALALMESSALFHAEDPLIFAVPKGTSILSNSTAVIGPVWGGDFPPELCSIFGLTAHGLQGHTLKTKVMNAIFLKNEFI